MHKIECDQCHKIVGRTSPHEAYTIEVKDVYSSLDIIDKHLCSDCFDLLRLHFKHITDWFKDIDVSEMLEDDYYDNQDE